MLLKRYIKVVWVIVACTIFCLASCKYRDNGKSQIIEVSNELLYLDITGVRIDSSTYISELVRVYATESIEKLGIDAPAIMGKYTIQSGQLQFRPLVAFQNNRDYCVKIGDSENLDFNLKLHSSEKFYCESIIPGIDTIPQNLLRLYINFSAPAMTGHAYDLIHLITQDGDTLLNPFVQLIPELWNEDKTRLTLWVDPGRQKRDLGPNEEWGPVMEEGKRYTLEVSRDWRSQKGSSLSDECSKEYFTSAPLRQRIVMNDWLIKPPKGHSEDPLVVMYKKPLDPVLLRRHLLLLDGDNLPVVGQSDVNEESKTWTFHSKEPWEPGYYYLVCSSLQEDLAGNSLNRPFDLDLQSGEVADDLEEYRIEFVIR